MRITPLGEHIGARVDGLDLNDLAGPERERLAAALNRALLEHVVLVLPDQTLGPGAYVRSLSALGEPMRQHRSRFHLPEQPDVGLVVNRGGMRPASIWHTDHTNHLEPPKVTALFARELPRRGGDTLFANMHWAWCALSPAEQDALRGRGTVNYLEDDVTVTPADRACHHGGIRHPLVRMHPETGRAALYFHVTKSREVDGVAPADTERFLAALVERTIRPEWTYRHRWRVGDVVLCDNRTALHRVEPDFDPREKRLLWRVILKGDRPIGLPAAHSEEGVATLKGSLRHVAVTSDELMALIRGED